MYMPCGSVKIRKILSAELTDALMERAAVSARRRANCNIHPTLDDPVQRFFNAMQPGTYVRPHRHTTPLRWEMFLVLQGRLAPVDCPAFGTACTPEHPLGATMVSSEGACAAYYHYRAALGVDG